LGWVADYPSLVALPALVASGGEQVFPDAATPTEILSKLNELHISHILDVQSAISGFLVPLDYPVCSCYPRGPGRESIESFQAGDAMQRENSKKARTL
jgi:hypothetical protein